jgi:hypothetical protein
MARYLECFTLKIENLKKNASWIESKTVEAIKVLILLFVLEYPVHLIEHMTTVKYFRFFIGFHKCGEFLD